MCVCVRITELKWVLELASVSIKRLFRGTRAVNGVHSLFHKLIHNLVPTFGPLSEAVQQIEGPLTLHCEMTS